MGIENHGCVFPETAPLLTIGFMKYCSSGPFKEMNVRQYLAQPKDKVTKYYM